jgi:hypothetical protein
MVTPLISGDFLGAAQSNMSAWLRAERIKRDTAKAKNDLEAYIIATREALESDELLQKVGVWVWGAGWGGMRVCGRRACCLKGWCAGFC